MTVPTAALTNIKKFKWLRERVAHSSSVSVLMNHIKDFVLKEEKINLEKIMNAMECQVSEFTTSVPGRLVQWVIVSKLHAKIGNSIHSFIYIVVYLQLGDSKSHILCIRN